MPPRVRVEDRITNAGGVIFGVALVAWYAGGSGAFDRLLEGATLMWCCAALGAVGTAVALAVQARGGAQSKKTFGNAAFFGVALLFGSLMLGALVNRFADGSAVRTQSADVRSFHHPSKGPKRVTLQSHGERWTFDADLAEGCQVGDDAALELRDGALGQPWVSEIRCSKPY